MKGDSLEDGTVSDLDLKLAGLVPSEHIFPSEQNPYDWKELEQHNDDISGTLLATRIDMCWTSGRNQVV